MVKTLKAQREICEFQCSKAKFSVKMVNFSVSTPHQRQAGYHDRKLDCISSLLQSVQHSCAPSSLREISDSDTAGRQVNIFPGEIFRPEKS